jgi:hypothetical protein
MELFGFSQSSGRAEQCSTEGRPERVEEKGGERDEAKRRRGMERRGGEENWGI